MTTKYQPGQVVGLDPNAVAETTFDSSTFAMLVEIVESRYTQITYPAELGYSSKIGVRWAMRTTTGKVVEKTFSTGIEWDKLASVSTDGKRLISKSPDFTGFKPSSDGIYLLQKAITAGFPAEKIVDDISVFEGHCFLVADDVNPKWKGSSKKAYPKVYHPEGFELAKLQQAAKAAQKQAAQNNYPAQTYPAPDGTFTGTSNTTATLQNTYAPPKVVVAPEVASAASAALMEILMGNGGKITRNEIPAALNGIAGNKGWPVKLRQDVTFALWDLPSLSGLVGTNPSLKIDGEQVSFK